ncbi:hypothetical protein HX071_18615, partial [Myroides marinus]|uniref:MBG domain-containing protein n=1 Tax=Myroides marinus TaxID=703342 RepID=UPI0025757F06
YTDKDGNPIQGAPTDAGIYNVTVTVEDKNYALVPISTTFTIDKAVITGVSFADKTVTYDGTAQLLEVTGTLPTGVTVAYTDNSKTEAGQYDAVAVLTGGNNYVDQTLNAKLTIDKATITGVSFADKTVTYNGNPQEVKLEGVPSDFEVTYVYSKDGNPIQGAPTEAGDYTVEAIVKGGNNYEDKKFEAKVTISKAMIPNGTLEGKTVTYNGNPQEVKVEGVPSDFEVTYVYSKDGNPIQGAPTEAGDYTVEAIVKGGKN